MRTFIKRGMFQITELDIDAYDQSFAARGLIIDMHTANIIQIGEGKLIQRVYHGSHMLSVNEIKELYGEECVLSDFPELRSRYVCQHMPVYHPLSPNFTTVDEFRAQK